MYAWLCEAEHLLIISAGSLKLWELKWRSECLRWNWSSLLSAAVRPRSGTPTPTPALTTVFSTIIPKVRIHTQPSACLLSFNPTTWKHFFVLQCMPRPYIQHWRVWICSKRKLMSAWRSGLRFWKILCTFSSLRSDQCSRLALRSPGHVEPPQ